MRGAAYTLIAVALVSVMIVFHVTSTEVEDEQRSAVSIVENMNGVIDALEEDLERAIYITAYRATIAQVEKITKTGEFINDTDAAFDEGMLNGTIENVSVTALDDASLSDWLDKTDTILTSRGYAFTYAITSLDQRHVNATHLSVSVTIDYNLSDYKGTRTYVRQASANRTIPVRGLEDPMYYVRSLGRISSTIRWTNTTDIPTLINASENNSKYVLSDKSPSWLMRLEGNMSSSPDGIESIVNGQRFLLQGIGDYDGRSSVDTLYFSNLSHTPNCMSDTPNWFRLDSARLSDYTGSTNVTC